MNRLEQLRKELVTARAAWRWDWVRTLEEQIKAEEKKLAETAQTLPPPSTTETSETKPKAKKPPKDPTKPRKRKK